MTIMGMTTTMAARTMTTTMTNMTGGMARITTSMTGTTTMTEEELARHDSKTLLQLLLAADARCDALTAERDRWQQAFAAQSAKLQIALDVGGEPVRAALKGDSHE